MSSHCILVQRFPVYIYFQKGYFFTAVFLLSFCISMYIFKINLALYVFSVLLSPVFLWCTIPYKGDKCSFFPPQFYFCVFTICKNDCFSRSHFLNMYIQAVYRYLNMGYHLYICISTSSHLITLLRWWKEKGRVNCYKSRCKCTYAVTKSSPSITMSCYTHHELMMLK